MAFEENECQDKKHWVGSLQVIETAVPEIARFPAQSRVLYIEIVLSQERNPTPMK